MDSERGTEHINHSKSLSLVTYLSESSGKLDNDPDVTDGRSYRAYSKRQLEFTDDYDDSDHFELQPRVSGLIFCHEEIKTYVGDGAESQRAKPAAKNPIDDNVLTKHSVTIPKIIDGLSDKHSFEKSMSSSLSDSSMEEFFQVNTNKVALLPPDPRTHKSKKYDEDVHGRASTSNVSRFSEVSKVQSLSPVQSPPIQVMSRVGEYDPNRIMSLLPPRKSPTSVDWSFASTDSLFSIHIGNNSFSREDITATSGYRGRSRELNKSQDMIVFTPCPSIPLGKADERGTDPEKKRLASTSQVPYFPKKSILQSWSQTQSPPIQVMDRVGGYDPNRIPSFVFARKSTAAAEWSVASTESLFSIHVGNNSFSRDTFITICEEPCRSKEHSKSREMIVYNPTPPIPLIEADEKSLDPEVEVIQIEWEEDVDNSVIEPTTDDQTKTTPGVTQSSSSPSLISNRSHHSDCSVKSSNSYAFPVRKKSKKKKKKCAWPQFYCSNCYCRKCARPSCCCGTLGCTSCVLPSCQSSKCGCSNCTWSSCCRRNLGFINCDFPSCHRPDCCSKWAWPSCCCSNRNCGICFWPSCSCCNCDCARCAWTCRCCNCSWQKCSWPSCHYTECSWEFCHTRWPNCLRWSSCYCAICSWVCCSFRNSSNKKVNHSANTSMQAEASNSVEEDERQTLPSLHSEEGDASRG